MPPTRRSKHAQRATRSSLRTLARSRKSLPSNAEATQGASSSSGGTSTPPPPLSDISSITPSTVEGALTRPLTAAEKKRAQKLKDDPLVTLLSPLWVECRRCGSKIKLSPKSTYDPFHWARHRERCLKRPPKIVEAMRQDAEEQLSSLSSSSPVSQPRALDSATPPLTPDTASLTSHSPSPPKKDIKEETPEPGAEASDLPPTPPPPPKKIPSQESFISSLACFRASELLAFDEYLHRSRRRPVRTSPLPIDPLEPDDCSVRSWQAWNWTQLKPAVWVTKEYPSSSSNLEDQKTMQEEGQQEEEVDDAMDVDSGPTTDPTPDEEPDADLDASSSESSHHDNLSAMMGDVGEGNDTPSAVQKGTESPAAPPPAAA